MSPPDSTLPPDGPANDTTNPPKADVTDPEIVFPPLHAIPAGWARYELHRAAAQAQKSIETLAADMQRIVALADGFARALDGEECEHE